MWLQRNTIRRLSSLHLALSGSLLLMRQAVSKCRMPSGKLKSSRQVMARYSFSQAASSECSLFCYISLWMALRNISMALLFLFKALQQTPMLIQQSKAPSSLIWAALLKQAMDLTVCPSSKQQCPIMKQQFEASRDSFPNTISTFSVQMVYSSTGEMPRLYDRLASEARRLSLFVKKVFDSSLMLVFTGRLLTSETILLVFRKLVSLSLAASLSFNSCNVLMCRHTVAACSNSSAQTLLILAFSSSMASNSLTTYRHSSYFCPLKRLQYCFLFSRRCCTRIFFSCSFCWQERLMQSLLWDSFQCFFW